ncbi:MAG: HAMP domain-containing protein [Armatimonadetes bacterium]|nr:HAMP domain-containing protein [Armatimonadota bacterium]
MRIGEKLILALVCVFGLYAALAYGVQGQLILDNFNALERKKAVQDLDRCRQSVDSELRHLETVAKDWSNWTDTYEYIAGKNPKFVEENLNDNALATIKVQGLYVLDVRGNTVWGRLLDSKSKPVKFTDFKPSLYSACEYLSGGDKVAGVVLVDGMPAVVVGLPVLDSEGHGPARGTMLLVRYLDSSLVQALSASAGVPFKAIPLGSHVSKELSQLIKQLKSHPEREVSESSSSLLHGYAVLRSPFGEPVTVLQSDTPRDISAQGQLTLQMFLQFLIVFGGCTTFVLLLLARRLVVLPLERLAKQVGLIGKGGDLSATTGLVNRRDEIGDLARSFEDMVGRLRTVRTKLVQSSREAGMADIARGMLHNVGNVLNSMSVATSQIESRLGQQRLKGLDSMVDLLGEHEESLPTFFAEDPKGSQVLPYLSRLAEALWSDHRLTEGEIANLRLNLTHIDEILKSHQALATAQPCVEPVVFGEIVSNSVSMLESSFERHGIRVLMELEDLPVLMLDRTKVVQILINMLSNSKDALLDNPQGDRHIQVRLTKESAGACCSVTDNGRGIAPDKLTEVFRKGYTTKATGSGLGLHFCFLSARELGGSLKIESEGLGHGAVAKLFLPIHESQEAAA